jgi:ERF superfamily
VQTTAIDQPTRSVSLTTTLTHSSGEWIASEWPVCPMSDIAAPHRVGSALTYARRYALFTMVGIAGEDDLDAPDLNCVPVGPSGDPSPSNRPLPAIPRRTERGNDTARTCPLLEPEASAQARDRLLREIVKLSSAEAADEWARKNLAIKNALIGKDARLIETAFAFRVSAFENAPPAEESVRPAAKAAGDSIPRQGGIRASQPGSQSRKETEPRIDKSTLRIPQARRYRDKEHLKFVASRPCLLCGRKPSEPHHLRFAQKPALGSKVSDEFTVPLCRLHHRELHRSRNEPLWWKTARIDAIAIARDLWETTRPKAVLPTSADESAAMGTGATASSRDKPDGSPPDQAPQIDSAESSSP